MESKAWDTLGQILNLTITLVLLFGLWSAIVRLEKQAEKAEVESERRFKSLEETLLERVGDKWTERVRSEMQSLRNLSRPQLEH
jgi:hypothetical protein